MATVAHQSPLDFPTATTESLTSTLINAAADLETTLHETERRVLSLTKQLRWAEARQDRMRKWLAALRTSLRTRSHHETTRLLKQIISDLNAA